MRSYHIRSTLGLPIVSCVLVSHRGSFRVELIFDSGSAFTQIHKTTLEGLGFSFDRINFSKWIKEGIDGLLGWDVIQKMDFEVLGTKKIIKVY